MGFQPASGVWTLGVKAGMPSSRGGPVGPEVQHSVPGKTGFVRLQGAPELARGQSHNVGPASRRSLEFGHFGYAGRQPLWLASLPGCIRAFASTGGNRSCFAQPPANSLRSLRLPGNVQSPGSGCAISRGARVPASATPWRRVYFAPGRGNAARHARTRRPPKSRPASVRTSRLFSDLRPRRRAKPVVHFLGKGGDNFAGLGDMPAVAGFGHPGVERGAQPGAGFAGRGVGGGD